MVKFGGYKRDGKIMPVWINTKDKWLLETLELRVQLVEASGEQTSIGAEVKKILKRELKEDYEKEFGKCPK